MTRFAAATARSTSFKPADATGVMICPVPAHVNRKHAYEMLESYMDPRYCSCNQLWPGMHAIIAQSAHSRTSPSAASTKCPSTKIPVFTEIFALKCRVSISFVNVDGIAEYTESAAGLGPLRDTSDDFYTTQSLLPRSRVSGIALPSLHVFNDISE